MDCYNEMGDTADVFSSFFPSVLCCFLFQGSVAMSKILVQKLGAPLHISPLLRSSNSSLQKTAMFLLNNMSRTSSLQTSLGKKKHEVLRMPVSSVAGT